MPGDFGSLDFDLGYIMEYYITIDPDAIEITRQVYTIWDALGDIGGLMDMLRLIGYPLIGLSNLLFGSGLSQFLFAALFKVQSKSRKDNVYS